MINLNGHDLWQVKRAAYGQDGHLDRKLTPKTQRKLVEAGFFAECTADDCSCGWFVLTEAGIALAAEHGIVRPATAGQVSR